MGNTDARCLVEARCICTKVNKTAAVLRVIFFLKMLCITAVILSGQLLNLTSTQKLTINHTSKTNYGYVMRVFFFQHSFTIVWANGQKVPSYSVFHILVENIFMNHPLSLSTKYLIGTSLKTSFLILVFLFLFPFQQVQ